ncbi:MAG: hypothetical protein WA134_03240 [Rhodoferax sp.]|uniref:hypothetical protein n=1 Tax=Rhodoferax sp. TaxID=50421 RepID=UPI003BB48CDA
MSIKNDFDPNAYYADLVAKGVPANLIADRRAAADEVNRIADNGLGSRHDPKGPRNFAYKAALEHMWGVDIAIRAALMANDDARPKVYNNRVTYRP